MKNQQKIFFFFKKKSTKMKQEGVGIKLNNPRKILLFKKSSVPFQPQI